jgi:hypothetical protein
VLDLAAISRANSILAAISSSIRDVSSKHASAGVFEVSNCDDNNEIVTRDIIGSFKVTQPLAASASAGSRNSAPPDYAKVDVFGADSRDKYVNALGW